MFDFHNKINRILFELSNLCHYAAEHKKCPLHFTDKPIILPKAIIYNVLDTAASWNYKGSIAFHTYNEPGIDPRLFILISYARTKCPEAYISIMSNGYYLDENLLSEYHEIGVNEFILSAYSDREYNRFISFKTNISLKINKAKLDDRMNLYSREKLNSIEPCLAPYNELMITREGYVGLCCLDWKREQIFGDLHTQSLEEILNSEKMKAVYNNLAEGKRELNICSRCDWSR